MISFLPLQQDIETWAVLRKTTGAPSALAELRGVVTSIPNENILIETLALSEARESSAIENIISTFAEVYQSSLFTEEFVTPAAKEIHQYAQALKTGFSLIKKRGILTNNLILQLQKIIEQNDAGLGCYKRYVKAMPGKNGFYICLKVLNTLQKRALR